MTAAPKRGPGVMERFSSSNVQVIGTGVNR